MKIAELQNIVAGQTSDIIRLTSLVENMAKVIGSMQLQIATLTACVNVDRDEPLPIVPCDCGLVTCEECLHRALGLEQGGKDLKSAMTGKPAPAKGSSVPDSTVDFINVMLPYMVSRVRVNQSADTDCSIERLQGYDGVIDFRKYLTRKERSLFKACFRNAKLSGKDACIALQGACERAGLKIA